MKKKLSKKPMWVGWGLVSFICLNPMPANASICFLPDCNSEFGDKDLNRDSINCRAENFVFYADGKCPAYSAQETCIYNSHYLKCSKEDWCKNNHFTISSCQLPEFPVNQCPNKLELFEKCSPDYERACKTENPAFTNSCQAGWTVDTSKSCSYSSLYGLCCNKCDGFTATSATAPRGYKINGECDSCSGKKYRLEALPCASGYSTAVTSCSSGYTFSSNGYSGDKTCGKCITKSCPTGFSAGVSSCSSGYTYSSNGYAGEQICGKCTYVASGCPNGYVRYNEKNFPYRNHANLAVATSNMVCIPSSSATYYNSSIAGLNSGSGYIFSTGTYTLTDTPILDTQTSGTLTINGSIGVVNIFVWSSGRIYVNGDFYNLGAVWLANGAKLCISGRIYNKTLKPPFSHHDSWCTRNWTGWGNDGNGPCYFDGECYY